MFDLFDLFNCISPLLVHQIFFVFLLSPACADQPWRFGHSPAELGPSFHHPELAAKAKPDQRSTEWAGLGWKGP